MIIILNVGTFLLQPKKSKKQSSQLNSQQRWNNYESKLFSFIQRDLNNR